MHYRFRLDLLNNYRTVTDVHVEYSITENR